MAIVSFWTEDGKETGQTSTAIAVATQMAIQHNKKVLLISTYENNKEIDAAYLKPQAQKTNLLSLLNLTKKSVGIESGVTGLMKIEGSNKLSPELIKDYTGIIFKDRLEVLSGYDGVEIPTIDAFYVSLIKKASMVYDIVIVDLKKGINQLSQDILTASDVVVYGMTQKRHSIEGYATSRKEGYTSKMYNVVGYIGRYAAQMNGVDVITFAGGVGENGPEVRSKICKSLEFLGVKIDEEKNNVRGKECEISTPDSKVKVYIVPTNEELMIARDTMNLVK